MNKISTSGFFVLVLLSSEVCLGSSGKLSPDLKKIAAQQSVDVIIQYRSLPSEVNHKNVERKGGRFKSEMAEVKAAVYSLPAAAAATLADDPEVLYISPDREVRATLDYTNPATGAQTAFSYGWTGAGVGIAVIDSGMLVARDLLGTGSSRVVYSQSFLPGVNNAADQYGHGTHVAGIAAGNANLSTGISFFKSFRGIAPNASLINLRVLDANGIGTDSAVIRAIDRAIALRNQYNIRVINLSLGRPVYESYRVDPLCRAVEKAWQAGIVVVVAAGNFGRNREHGTDGYATITAPGNHPLVITVGAMKARGTESRADDEIASYSSKGPTLLDHVVKPDIVAPGNRVISLVAARSLIYNTSTDNRILYSYYQRTFNKNYSGDYYKLSGTSMAAPMVSGAVALMLQKDRNLRPDTIKARLMRTATKTFPPYSVVVDSTTGNQYTSQYDIFTVGAGYLDIWAALNDTQIVDGNRTAASPRAVLDALARKVVVVNTDGSIWGKAAMWGNSSPWSAAAVWGSNVFLEGAAAVWGSAALWGSAAVWGSGATSGTAAIWGTTALWSTSTQVAGESLNQLVSGEN